MALTRAEKEAVVAEVAEIARNSYSAVGAEYRGLTVAEMTELRVEARKSGVEVRVVKNSLAKLAVADSEFACMQDALVGPLILAFGREDPGSAARVAEAFAKKHDKFQVKLVALSGQLLDGSEVGRVAKLPTRDEALATLMSVMKAPVQKLTSTLNEVPSKLVRTVAAVRDAKEAA